MSESTDFNENVLDNYKCGNYYFSSKFDSGNLGRVEWLETCPERDIFGDIVVHEEINAWTTPDCFGTPNESTNRTWFYFSIKGGESFHNVRINVKNLNRQSKLFGHGMSPVMRVGRNGKWERIRDKPIYQNEEDNFMIGFIHKVNENLSIETFYAFTYPFTYTECQNMLLKFDLKFGKNYDEIISIINRLLNNEEKLLVKKSFKYKKGSKLDLSTSTSSEEASGNEGIYEKMQLHSLQNDIYYHRELLINSIEGRRIDLLTITSYHGIEENLEQTLLNLFPENSRCHTFKDKKVIFLSSRVHPGETPASFVLNGFLNLILDKKSSIANILRKIYVFKIIPILNPDGVFRGYYRTDTLGQNLNRMYIDTELYRHPSIYAVKKLIRFYHFGTDLPDENETSMNSVTTLEYDQKLIFSEINKTNLDNDVNLEKLYTVPLCSSKTNISSESEVLENSTTADSCSKKSYYNKKFKEQKLRKTNIKTTHSSLMRNFEHKLKESHRHIPLKKNYTGTKLFLPQSKILNNNKSNDSSTTSTGQHCKLFLYIDMHGHASKKGVFMYGNHFPYTPDAVDCMLLPRLMTINCQHFHFDACNFSERNMYKKEKRDGLSKEGSGRVAVYKMTGLIKSYTLECNYNCGKYVNVLPSRGSIVSQKTNQCNPPKYTPAIFEEVGRALGSSILDITNSNSISRLQNSDFRNIQGLRLALRNEIEKNSYSYRQSSSTTTHKSTSAAHRKTNNSKKRNILSTTKSALPTYEIAKENKFHTIPWKTKGSNVVTQTVTQPNVSLKISRNIKKTAFKIRPVNLYGKKDTSSIKKKSKILVETSNASRKDSPTCFTAVPNKKVKISFRNAITATTSEPTNACNSHLTPPHIIALQMLPIKTIKSIEKTVNDQEKSNKNQLKSNSVTNASCSNTEMNLKKCISDTEIVTLMDNSNTFTEPPSEQLLHTATSSKTHNKTLGYIKLETTDNIYKSANSIDATTLKLNGKKNKVNIVLEDGTSNSLKQKIMVSDDNVIFKRKNNKKQISRY